jgi:uncharacterized membrane protein
MFRAVMGTALAICAMQGRAGVLRCTFTEPFFTITFDSATHKVTRTSTEDGKVSVVSTTARIQRTIEEDDDPMFEVFDEKEMILALRLSGRGSDGMSEAVFPFQARYHGQNGACDTVKYPRWDFDRLLEDLQAAQ